MGNTGDFPPLSLDYPINIVRLPVQRPPAGVRIGIPGMSGARIDCRGCELIRTRVGSKSLACVDPHTKDDLCRLRVVLELSVKRRSPLGIAVTDGGAAGGAGGNRTHPALNLDLLGGRLYTILHKDTAIDGKFGSLGGPSSAMVTPRETLLMVLGVKVGVPETTSTATPVLNWFFLVSNSKKE